MTHRTWIELNTNALEHNISALTGLLAAQTKFCAVLKANAYGHGFKEMAQLTRNCGVDTFAVDTLENALYLKDAFPTATVIIIGYVISEALPEVLKHGLHFVVYDRDRIRELDKLATELKTKALVHLKIETGTMRLGVEAVNLRDVLETFKTSPNVSMEGLYTHFATLEDTSDTSFAMQQYERFVAAKNMVLSAGFKPQLIHTASSVGTILYPSIHETMVRAGISLYGLWSAKDVEMAVLHHRIRCTLQPVLSWKTRVAQLKTARVGTPISYGLTETMPRNGRIAILPVGYFDGYDRRFSSRAEVLIKGHRCKVMGRVCMNMMMVDVSNVPTIKPGDEVTLLGRSGTHSVPADELARVMGGISYELMARINPLIPRVIIEKAAVVEQTTKKPDFQI